MLILEDWGNELFLYPCGCKPGQIEHNPDWDYGQPLSWTCPVCGLIVSGFNLDAIGSATLLWPDGKEETQKMMAN